VITLEDAVITGGFYLSSHTMYGSLMGKIHSFMLPSLLQEGDGLPFFMIFRRLVQYLHNAFVLDDFSDKEHLPPLSTMDGARNLFSLTTIALLANVLDERTYQLPTKFMADDIVRCHEMFDLNAIPVVEHHQNCYARGLALNLILWYFQKYTFSRIGSAENLDGYAQIFVPFAVHIGRQIIRYKYASKSAEGKLSPTAKGVEEQVIKALFCYEGMQQEYEIQAANDPDGAIDSTPSPSELCDLNFDISMFEISERRDFEGGKFIRSSDCYLKDGQNNADDLFFGGLSSHFYLNKNGTYPIYTILLKSSRNDC
jgi:hypothetical protein